MESTSTSSSEDWILKLEQVKLSFMPVLFRPASWREVFTRTATRNPNDPVRMVEVARSIDLTVNRGDRIGLLGVNGAGKTSLCRMIAGMYRPNSGRVRIRGTV